MLKESFLASTLKSTKSNNAPLTLKDVGISLHELQPQSTLRHGYKKSSTSVNCLALSESHIFAAQAEKAVIHVYNRARGNQEATVPFPERIHSLTYAGEGSGILVLGTEGGRLILWELASGRQVSSAASHLQSVSSLVVDTNSRFILSGSSDTNVHIWSLPNLVSFSQPSSFSENEESRNSPVQSFSNHRSPITALACGQSRPMTNFGISASRDNTCYVWSISSCEVLRTILLPATPLCFALDPADRAFYAGYDDGSVQLIDFYDKPLQSSDRESLHERTISGPVQFDANAKSFPASSESGPVQCLCVSFDGTLLLSGHEGGKIFSWDIGKRKVLKLVTDLGQSVTNIIMLEPDGLPRSNRYFQINTVVKPRLDFFKTDNNGSSIVPSNYTLQLQITASSPVWTEKSAPQNISKSDFQTALTSPTFSQTLFDEALQSLYTSQVSEPIAEKTSETDLGKMERLEETIATLKEKLNVYATASARSRARRVTRMEKREEIGQKKRLAYFEAKAKGENGDDAMQAWAVKEREVDMLSDEEELAAEANPHADI